VRTVWVLKNTTPISEGGTRGNAREHKRNTKGTIERKSLYCRVILLSLWLSRRLKKTPRTTTVRARMYTPPVHVSVTLLRYQRTPARLHVSVASEIVGNPRTPARLHISVSLLIATYSGTATRLCSFSDPQIPTSSQTGARLFSNTQRPTCSRTAARLSGDPLVPTYSRRRARISSAPLIPTYSRTGGRLCSFSAPQILTSSPREHVSLLQLQQSSYTSNPPIQTYSHTSAEAQSLVITSSGVQGQWWCVTHPHSCFTCIRGKRRPLACSMLNH
jgi:hypothetical protein